MTRDDPPTVRGDMLTEAQLREKFPHGTEDFFRRCRETRVTSEIPTARPAQKKLIRQRSGDGLNRWEREYLAVLRNTLDGFSIHREVSLPLANGLRYKVDFLAGKPGAPVLAYEVKGFRRSTGIAKVKMAATVYPWITFYLVTKRRRKYGAGWSVQEVRG